MSLSDLNRKFLEIKSREKEREKLSLKCNIYFLAQKAYDRGDKNAFKFAEQDCKILGLE